MPFTYLNMKADLMAIVNFLMLKNPSPPFDFGVLMRSAASQFLFVFPLMKLWSVFSILSQIVESSTSKIWRKYKESKIALAMATLPPVVRFLLSHLFIRD